MKDFEKMTKTQFAVFCLLAVFSGIMIGIGGIASLVAISTMGEWGRLVGACLFSLAIFAIMAFEMKLFTGMVASIPAMSVKHLWQLVVCFLCNALGVLLVGAISEYTPFGGVAAENGAALIAGKLDLEKWPLVAVCSSMLCGVLITTSVRSPYHVVEKGLSATLGVVFPIIVFAFCGFDHSVANMLYFYYLGEFSWKIVAYVLLTIVGNVIGGVALPLVMMLREKARRQGGRS
ncbi:MAG: formate/nitrite transporter family protein [Clostridia bacterium]|nr:formate/nitrite transporter family protein [Clostridia bacterium]